MKPTLRVVEPDDGPSETPAEQAQRLHQAGQHAARQAEQLAIENIGLFREELLEFAANPAIRPGYREYAKTAAEHLLAAARGMDALRRRGS